ncbi:unnamed protein product, partial [Mesorhabditis belari]|uniref:t-SNARE coiled-coil homology domain-containing protein n=1 Tax=Mesorhabditis belari TaxID=2138241 RepID=A0AAF3FEP2_9BILA
MESKRQVSLLLERYERIAKGEVASLKKMLQQINELESNGKDAQQLRNQALRIEDQLLLGIEQILSTREKLESELQDEFDTQIEPIRKLIQTTVNALRQMKQTKTPSTTFNGGIEEEEVNVYAEELDLQMNAGKRREADLKMKLEETKRMTEESRRLETDIEDLNEIFNQLQTLVYQQHDMVDSIEEHVEQARNDVGRGNEQLKSALKSKNAKVPIITAVVGGLALGGPVGVAAGSMLAGTAAAVGGAFAGLYGGRWIKKSNAQ